MNSKKMKFETKRVKIDRLITEDLQTRAEMHEDCIADYAETYRDTPDEMPPITVFYDSMLDRYYLADGFHRVCACRQNGSDTILANVSEGTHDDALRFALRANANNGIHRSNADKQYALSVAWENWRMLLGKEPPKGKTGNKPNGLPSGEQLAAICCVSHRTAAYFIEKQVDCNLQPTSGDDKAGGIVVPDIADDAPDALTVTRKHLEERDPSLRALLKDKRDRFGIAIPEKLMEAFLSRVPQELVRDLNKLYAELEKRRLDGEIVFAPFVGRAMTHLDNLINTIRHGRVYCVCRMCRGEGCGSCNELGFQTRPQYERNPPEFKAEKQ